MGETRVVAVTGGSGGSARAAVRLCADTGYDVAVLARGRAGLDGAAADVLERGRRGLAVPTDVADAPAVDAAVEAIEAELGPLDVGVNCAFTAAQSHFWDTTPGDYDRITAVTYSGQVHGTRSALRVMRPRDHGGIVTVSSSVADRAIPPQAGYCAGKHAAKGFTESRLAELQHEGSTVRIGRVTSPGVNTPQFDWNVNKRAGHPMPVPPIYQPEVAAKAILEQAEHPPRNGWVGIPTALTMLGNKVALGVLDWSSGRTGIDSQQTDLDAPRLGSSLVEPQDQTSDRGPRGSFDDQAQSFDPVSILSATVGRTVGSLVGRGLAGVGDVLDRRP